MTTETTYSDNNMLAFQSRIDIIEQAVEAVERLMNDVVNSQIDVLRDASHHILEAGGKRIRPRLTLLSFAATGGSDLMKVVPPAAAIELVHTASVVHDDINDHGIVRRGRPSVNALWGRTFALLTGDFLFAKVYELMAPYNNLNILLAEGTIALVEGETLQASAVKNKSLNSETYMKVIGLKTAALFRSGTKIGGTLSNATEAEIEALGDFGYNIGLAFQIVDDILDLVGDEATIGKTTGLDSQQGKGFASVEDDDGTADVLREKMLDGDYIERAKKQANDLAESAIERISIIPASPYKDELIRMARSVVEREL
jgi:geranylgeranyl pyrophosphate synthase